MNTNINFQMGLLHMVHLLANVDGVVDEREKQVLRDIKREEEIPDSTFLDFEKRVNVFGERDIYREGIDMLNQCSEEEKLRIFVHLYRLAEADNELNIREVRLLLYALKITQIEFDDVVMTARMAGVA